MCIAFPRFFKKEIVKFDNVNTLRWSDFELEATLLINLFRREKNLKPIKRDNKFYQCAAKRNLDIINFGKVPTNHRGMRETNMVLYPLGISYTAENLAWGFKTPQSLVTHWLNSPMHLKIILNPKWEYTGLAKTIDTNGVVWYCQVFGR